MLQMNRMLTFPPNSAKFRSIAGIAGGLLMICNVIFFYTYMHVVFFGVPYFDLNTPKGRNEINYLLSNLVLLGFGAFFIYLGVRARRVALRDKTN